VPPKTPSAAPLDDYDCQPGDSDEAESCGSQSNDGPYMTPATFGSISAGETICGTLYAEGGVRDVDYFHFDVTAPGGEDIRFTCSSDATMGYFIMLMNANATNYYTYSIGVGLDEIFIGPTFLAPGTYTIRVAMNVACPDACQDYGCGTNPVDLTNGNYRYRLTMTSHVPVAGDDCSLAQELTDGSNSFDMTGYTPDDAGMLALYGYGEYNGWFVYEATCSGIVHFQFCPDQELIASGEAGDQFGLAVWTECYASTNDPNLCGRKVLELVNNEYGSWIDYNCSTDGPSEVTLGAIGGQAYYLEVFALDAPNADFITGNITVYCQEVMGAYDQCTSPGDLGTGEVSQFVSNLWTTSVGPYVPNYGFTYTQTACDHGGLDGIWMDKDVWYSWTADQTGWWTADFCDPCGWDAMVEVYEGTACPNTSPRYPIACGDDECGGSGSMPKVEFYADAGQSYLIRLGSWQDNYHDGGEVGEAHVNITYSSGPAARPANDECTGATVEELTPGSPLTRYGTLDNASNHGCLAFPATVWEGFTLTTCADVTVDYCPQEGGAEITVVPGVNDENYWSAVEVLVSGCPCDAGTIMDKTSGEWGLCPQEYYLKTLHFNALPPGTYYYPVLPGFKGCPLPSVSGCDYGIAFAASEVTCAYCSATADPDGCASTTTAFIQRVTLADLDRGTPAPAIEPAECTGYSDFTALSASVYEGRTYMLEVTAAQQTGALDAYDVCYAYIDWDQNFSLNQPGEVFLLDQSGPNNRIYTREITIPEGIPAPGEGLSGETVMRIRIGAVTEARVEPCGTRAWGEVEDYTLSVAEYTTCCVDRTGDVNNSGNDEPTIGDISALINVLFIAGTCEGYIACYPEADVNQSGGYGPTCEDLTIGDISYLIEYLFLAFCDPFPCPDQFDLPACL